MLYISIYLYICLFNCICVYGCMYVVTLGEHACVNMCIRICRGTKYFNFDA